MKVIKQGFSSILKDNDKFYVEFVMDALKHSDPQAEVILHKFEKEIKVRIKPSQPEFKQDIITNLLAAHRLFHIKIIFSKSLAIAESISYLVEM